MDGVSCLSVFVTVWINVLCLYSLDIICSQLRLTSRRRCCVCPAAWSPRRQTVGLLPAHHWAGSPQAGPDWLLCCCRHRHSLGQVKAPRASRRTRSHRTPAACHGQLPSPLRLSLGGKRATERKMRAMWERPLINWDWESEIWKAQTCNITHKDSCQENILKKQARRFRRQKHRRKEHHAGKTEKSRERSEEEE